MIIYFKYSNDNWSSETSSSMNALSCIERKERGRETAETLSGTIVSHLKFKRKKYDIIISANELYQPAKVTFLDAFIDANNKRFSVDNSTYVDVEMVEDESIEFVQRNKHLPKYSFTLKKKYKE